MPFVRNIFVLCTFLVGFAISAHAQTGEEWTGEKAGREKKAGQWRDEFGKLNAQIPTLSPAEERWLKNEIEDTIADAGGNTHHGLSLPWILGNMRFELQSLTFAT